MAKKKKNKNNSPRRKRMNREKRLVSGARWLQSYTGNNVVRSYMKWYGQDAISAIIELRLLGVSISDERLDQAKQNCENRAKHRKMVKQKREKEWQELFSDDSDENFSFIAGYTSGGAPYGVTWEEMDDEPDC